MPIGNSYWVWFNWSGFAATALIAISILPQAAVAQIYPRPTYSSPIAVSLDDRLIWVVNPSDDSVSVIRPDNNTRITKIAVGDEPESVALTPDGQYAYVANAAGNSVTVIRIQDPAWGTFGANVVNTITTGAEPWNIVTSPDGLRVFVANSAQDTITVINAATRAIIGHVDLRNSLANDPDRSRHFQPRGLAVTADNTKLYVTRFLSFTKPGGRQGDDLGKEGLVAVLDINTSSMNIADYSVARTVALAPQITGFRFPGLNDDTAAFPNQLQSIVIRGDRAYLANIAASPTGPLRFNLDTHAFINQIGTVNGNAPTDLGALNLHLAARDPEPGKRKLFFANAWAIAFTSQSGAGRAYAVSAASDLLVKLNVAVDNSLGFTVDGDTTRYIDLNDPDNAATSGPNAGKNPQGIAINSTGTRAYVANFLSRNVSVINLTNDTVIAVVSTSNLPAPGSQGETNLVGAEMFFSSRGNFDSIPGTNSLRDRLSSEGWQSCASCHFKGLTDGVIWQFAAGPRKSVPLNSTFNPLNRSQQRLLNYSAIFDEVEDFEINVRNISGPGALAGGALDPNHGLLIGDNGDLNVAPSAVNGFALPNANRPQVTVTLPGSANKVPALTAMREWVRFAIRTPNAPVAGLPNAPLPADLAAGRTLFTQAGCANCHGGQNWTVSLKDFTSPPPASEINTERTPPHVFGNPVGSQYLNRFLRDIGSFNLGVPGQGNPLGNNVGADEKAAPAVVGGVLQAAQDGLGIDYNSDGKGAGFNVPSLLGLHAVPPYMHNGAAESLAAVVADVKHRTDNGRMADRLSNPADQAQVVKFLESIDVRTVPLQSLIVLETFDGVPEGSLPGGWSVSNQTTVVTAGLDLNNPSSDSYLNWVVINSNRLVTIFGTNRISSALDAPLVSGNLAYAESDRRSGSQVQVLFSPDYDLGSRSNVYLSFHSIYAQNQDSSASVEYSIDGGNTWLPALYMMDQSDIIRDGGGAVDAGATLTTARPDQAYGLSYGTWIGAPITPALAPFISGRVNDDQVESKRIEAIRLPQADHQSRVRLRFAQSGTGSWYFGVDDIGLYGDPSALDTTPPQLTCPQSVNKQATSFAGATVNFTVTATDDTDTSPVVSCSPASGSVFPIGNTFVVCTARDSSGNSNTCSFVVVVRDLAAFPQGGTLTLRWNLPNAILEEADAPTGPWRTVPVASSPYTVPPNEPSQFYRLRYLTGPRLSKVQPSIVPANNPAELYLFGVNLNANSLVRVNGLLLTGLTVVESNVVRGTVGSLPAGNYDVEVVDGVGVVLAVLKDGLDAASTPALRIEEPPSYAASAAGRFEIAGGSVQLASGEFTHSAVDLHIPGRGLNFVWQRTYRSRLGPNTAQGNGWTHNYDMRIEQDGQNLVLHHGGRADLFRLQADGNFASDGFSSVLVREDDGSFKLAVAPPGMGSFVGTTDTNALELVGNRAGRVSYDKLEDLLIVAGNPAGRRASSLFTTTLDFGPDVAPSGQAGSIVGTSDVGGEVLFFGGADRNDTWIWSEQGDSVLDGPEPIWIGGLLPRQNGGSLTYLFVRDAFDFGSLRGPNGGSLTTPLRHCSEDLGYFLGPNGGSRISEFFGLSGTVGASARSPQTLEATFHTLDGGVSTGPLADGFYRVVPAQESFRAVGGGVSAGPLVDGFYRVVPAQESFRAVGGGVSAGKLERVTDADGNSIQLDYDIAGRLTAIMDTLGRTNRLAYNAGGQLESITDFTERSVAYAYYGPNEAGGNEGDLKSVTSSAVIGTPNGNDFPAGKTITYTYSKGFADERLNHNLLTITDASGITVLSNTYASATSETALDFDRVLRQSTSNSVNPAQQNHVDIHYVAQTPAPSNGFVVVKAIVRDRVGNVGEHSFDSDNRLIRHRAYTGRADPTLPTTDAVNRPFGQLRASDPAFFETLIAWNGDSLPTQIIYANSNRVDLIHELDVDPDAKRLSRGNLRLIRRLPGPLAGGQTELAQRFDYTPTVPFPFGTNLWADRLTRQIDARGNSTRHSYDTNGNRLQTQYAVAGVVENWEYNPFGQVAAHVFPPDGNGYRRRDKFDYHASGPTNGYLRAATVDFGGQALSYVYSVNIVGLVERIMDPLGSDTRFIWNALNQLVRVQSAAVTTSNGPVRYEKLFWYDDRNNVVRVDEENRDHTGALGANTHFTMICEYNALNRPTRLVREEGFVNLANTVLKLADIPAPQQNQFVVEEAGYDANGCLAIGRSGEAVSGNQSNSVVQFAHDERNLLFRVIRAPDDAGHSTTQFDYDGNGNRVRVARGIEAAPRVTQYGYDGFDRPTSSTDAMGNVARYSYDAADNLVQHRVEGELNDGPGSANNVRLAETTLTHDAMNRRTRADRAFFNPANQSPIGDGAATTLWAYAPNFTLLSETNDRGFATTYSYDTVARLQRFTDAKGNYRTFTYNSNSLVTVIEEVEISDLGAPDQRFVSRVIRDPLGRTVRTIDSANNVWQYAWNSRRLCVAALDARSNVTHYAYDGLGRRISTSRVLTDTGTGVGTIIGNIVTRQTWDNSSRLVASIDGNSNVTRYAYDALNRRIVTQKADETIHQTGSGAVWLLGQATPDLTGFGSGYDVHDNAVITADANGTVVTTQHDLNNRLMSRSIAPGPGVAWTTTSELYTYDGRSRLVRARNDDSDATFAFDSISNLGSSGQDGLTTTYTYDGVGNNLSIVYSGGLTVANSFSSLSDLSAVTANSQPVANFSHVGRRVERIGFGNGVRADFISDGIAGVQNAAADFGVKQVVGAQVTRMSDSVVLDKWTFKFEPADAQQGGLGGSFWWFDWDWFSPSKITTGAEPWNLK